LIVKYNYTIIRYKIQIISIKNVFILEYSKTEDNLLISTVITAFISFVSTNIDDIFILMLFFTQINSVIKTRHIVIGQYLGIAALTAISIIGALGVSLIPQEYVGTLGLIPIYLGIKEYVDHKKESMTNGNIAPQELENIENSKLEGTTDTQGNPIITFISGILNPSIIKVFSVTLANGGDNIGVYIPIFTSMNLGGIAITILIFMLLTALWCFIGLKLSEHPFVQGTIIKYQHIFVPIVFIALGIFILMQSGTISFIYNIVF